MKNCMELMSAASSSPVMTILNPLIVPALSVQCCGKEHYVTKFPAGVMLMGNQEMVSRY